MRFKQTIATTFGCMVMTVCSGMLSALQIRLNGGLGEELHSPLIAALISFIGGTICAWAVVVLRPQSRRALARLRTQRISKWLYTGGLYGAFYVTMLNIAGPIIGVAATVVAAIAGKVVGGLVIDALRFFSNAPITVWRVIGAGLVVVAVVVSQMGMPLGAWQPVLLLLLGLSGAGLSAQSAVQGKLNTAIQSPAIVTALSFSLGTVAVLVVVGVVAASGGLHNVVWSQEWWLYMGGVLGAVCVTVTTLAVPVIGVLRLVIATAAGQFIGALLLDYFLPLGPGLQPQLVIAACITFVGLWAAGHMRAKAVTLLDTPASGGKL